MSLYVIAVLTDAANTPVCLEAAAAAGRHHSSVHLRAVHVSVDPDRIVEAAEELDFQRLRETREGSAADRARHVRAAFDTWSAAHPDVPIALEIRVGQEEQLVADETRSADLVVLVHGGNLDAGDALHAAVFTVEAPILLLPRDWRGEGWPHVAIAWSGNEVAERAVAGALPWLAWAERVTILTIGDDADPHRLCEDLGLAGINAVVEHRDRDQETLGEQLVTLAREVGADALVAGAYRHNALVEWLVGGTTRHLLAHADLPLFLAH